MVVLHAIANFQARSPDIQEFNDKKLIGFGKNIGSKIQQHLWPSNFTLKKWPM